MVRITPKSHRPTRVIDDGFPMFQRYYCGFRVWREDSEPSQRSRANLSIFNLNPLVILYS